MIPYGRQEISEADIEAVCRVLRSDYLTQGPVVPAFEQAVADYCGAKEAVAVNSATSALHIACMALDVGPGDWLWTSPNTFVASANCARYCGASVDFVDINPKTYNLCPEKLESKLKLAKASKRLPKVVVPVHFAGQPCDMLRVHELAQQYGFSVIEDASHAIGSSYDGIPVGSCTHSDITIFSFHPVKIITSGEGGMALSNNSQIINRMKRLRSHGITSDPSLMQSRPESEIWNYQQIELGLNYRLTDISAALGRSQLPRLDDFVARRRVIARRYDQLLHNLPITTPWQLPGTASSYHLYPVCVDEGTAGISQRYLYASLRRGGVAANLHYIPVHRQPYYEQLGFREGDFPEAERFHRKAISLPVFPALGAEQQQVVVNCIKEALVP